jgi:carnitine O-palmitoyltransferase 2
LIHFLRKEKDVLYSDGTKNHIVIIHRGNFFKFNLINDNGNLLKPEEVLASIEYILSLNSEPAEYSPGVLTSENRDIWATVRANLEKIPQNNEALNAIDSALYCMALDDFGSEDPDAMSHNFLYGDPKNRYKTKHKNKI